MNNIDKYKANLKRLGDMASLMNHDLYYRKYDEEERKALPQKTQELIKKVNLLFEKEYQAWYTESIAIIRQIIPDRLGEFIDLYKGDGKRKDVNQNTYNIQDWLGGTRSGFEFTGEKYFDDLTIASMRFDMQTKILKSAETRFTSTLIDLRQIVQADLFDNEIEVARELLKKGFLRAAGVICGVIIEKHLKEVTCRHQIAFKRKNPSLNELNEALRQNEIIEIPMWRFIQRLGDIRNLCAHDSEKEPSKEDVSELIGGTDKLIKSVY